MWKLDQGDKQMTPMMQRYVELKEEYNNELLFFRLGDFYELFFDDAKTASAELGLTLTGRDCGMAERAPMCGVPHHAASTYIKRLIDKGYSVAMCEQLSLPVKGKGIVERGVVRVITPGTVMDETLEATENNFVASVYMNGKAGSVAWCDISTGQFYAVEVEEGNFQDVLAMISPKEIIANKEYKQNAPRTSLLVAEDAGIRISTHFDYAFNPMVAHKCILDYFKIKSTKIFDFDMGDVIVSSVGALIEYLMFTQKKTMANISKINVVKNDEILILDKVARECLEITHQYREPTNKKGTLLWVLDETKTPMGARTLSGMLSRPLHNIARINQRLDAIEKLVRESGLCKDIRSILSKVVDMSRLCARIASRDIMPQQIQALCKSLDIVEELKKTLLAFGAGLLKTCQEKLSPMQDLVNLLERAIVDAPPSKLDDGGYIKDGYNAKLDELRDISKQGHMWLAKLEESERAETGLKELKLGFNRIAGYYYEVPKRLSGSVPLRFERRATTANAERYVTPELKELEGKVLSASEKALDLELKLLGEIRTTLEEHIPTIMQNSEQIAIVDVMATFAMVSISQKWIRPKLNDEGMLSLKDCRHPVVEKLIGTNKYIANNCNLESKGEHSMMLITGPNMAGKSTYMRSIAHCVLLAHVGSFVPCSVANVPLVDRIFTRIGASDSMLTGQSTFMVEMNEVSNILHNATPKSLVLLDEIGRGTGTRDGLALARAITSYVVGKIGCLTMFATHFHELTDMAKEVYGLENFKVLVEKNNNEIVFLHKLEQGIEQNSFGVDVAKLAGLPAEVVEEARKLYDR